MITICIQEKACVLGRVTEGALRLSPAGRMIRRCWMELPERFPHVRLGAVVIMPNHIHGVVRFLEASDPTEPRAPLGDVIGALKSLSTRRYAEGVRQRGWPPFPGRLWQRSFYEHILRDGDAIARAEHYIRMNPTHWKTDAYHP